MRLIIEARLEGDQASFAATEAATIIAVVERQDRSVVGLGLTLAEGRALLVMLDAVIVGEFEDGVRLLVTVAEEDEGVFPVGHVGAAKLGHAKVLRIESDATLQIADAQHGVQIAEVLAHGRFSLCGLSMRYWLA